MGAFVSEMGVMLSFVFINAYTSQFFLSHPSGLDHAKSFSEKIISTSMVIGLGFGILLGQIVDKRKIAPVYVGVFAIRGLGLLLMTCFVTDFER